MSTRGHAWIGALPQTLCGVSRRETVWAIRLLSSFLADCSDPITFLCSLIFQIVPKGNDRNHHFQPPDLIFLNLQEKQGDKKNCLLFPLPPPPRFFLLYSLRLTSTICFSHHSNPFTPLHPSPPHPSALSLHLFFPYLALSPRPANRAWDWLINGCLSAPAKTAG